jgi:hypothetical protein
MLVQYSQTVYVRVLDIAIKVQYDVQVDWPRKF